VYSGRSSRTLRRNVRSPFSGSKSQLSSAVCLLLAGYLLGLLFKPEEGYSMFLWNVGEHLPDRTVSPKDSTCQTLRLFSVMQVEEEAVRLNDIL
jgi:hypothetical protein